MRRGKMDKCLGLTLWLGIFLTGVPLALADEGHHSSHRKVDGVVIEKGGHLAVQTPDGSTYEVNPNQSRRHGHEPFKAGDQVSVLFDENNTIMEIHPVGSEGVHQQITGKLIHVGKMKNEINIQTNDGERVYPLDKLDIKTRDFPDGSEVTAEINEAGRVIDLHRAPRNRQTSDR